MGTGASPSVKKAAQRSRHPITQKAGMPMHTSTHSAWPPLQHADQPAFTCYANTSSIRWVRSEEHTSELQSLMRISYAVLCLKKNSKQTHSNTNTIHTSNNY